MVLVFLDIKHLSFLCSAFRPSEIAQRKREGGHGKARPRHTLTGFRGSLYDTAYEKFTVRAGFLTSGKRIAAGLAALAMTVFRFTVAAPPGIFTQIPLLSTAARTSRSDLLAGRV